MCFHFLGYADTVFFATFTEANISPFPDPIVFNDPQINPGGHYDPENGIYMVPVTSLYEFHTQIFNTNNAPDGGAWAIIVTVDGVQYTDSSHYNSVAEDNVSITTTVLLDLKAGQSVWVTPLALTTKQGVFTGRMASWFSGRLIMAT